MLKDKTKKQTFHNTQSTETGETALLISVILPEDSRILAVDSINELEHLAISAGAVVAEKVIQSRKVLDKGYLLGRGKIQELIQVIENSGINLVIFDSEITATQNRNIQDILGCKVIDRTDLILDIFANHARTKEAKLQVELAQLKHTLPRLTKMWKHLSRIEGGIGFRGPGEKQIELDRRIIKDRISKISKQIIKIDTQMANRRKNRRNFYQIALVGYTNAGKSTLMNALCHEDMYVADKLFATLDSTIRKLFINHELSVLLVDTVGFIRKLPTDLVASFKSTLSEVEESDILIHVVSADDEEIYHKIEAVNTILKDLDVLDKPVITVFNKCDLIMDNFEDNFKGDRLKNRYSNAIFVSAKQGFGLDLIKQRIESIIKLIRKE